MNRTIKIQSIKLAFTSTIMMQNLAVPRSLHGLLSWYHPPKHHRQLLRAFHAFAARSRAVVRISPWEKHHLRSWSRLDRAKSLFEPSRCWEFSSTFRRQWPWGSRWIMNALTQKKRKQSWRSCCRIWIECTTSAILKTLHPRTFVESSICSRPWWYKAGHAPSFWQSP